MVQKWLYTMHTYEESSLPTFIDLFTFAFCLQWSWLMSFFSKITFLFLREGGKQEWLCVCLSSWHFPEVHRLAHGLKANNSSGISSLHSLYDKLYVATASSYSNRRQMRGYGLSIWFLCTRQLHIILLSVNIIEIDPIRNTQLIIQPSHAFPNSGILALFITKCITFLSQTQFSHKLRR